MKFYEFEEPYCALIKANNKKEAIKKYTTEVCEDDEDEIEFHQITFEEAEREVKSAIYESSQDFFDDWDSMITDMAKKFLKKDNAIKLLDNSLM